MGDCTRRASSTIGVGPLGRARPDRGVSLEQGLYRRGRFNLIRRKRAGTDSGDALRTSGRGSGTCGPVWSGLGKMSGYASGLLWSGVARVEHDGGFA